VLYQKGIGFYMTRNSSLKEDPANADTLQELMARRPCLFGDVGGEHGFAEKDPRKGALGSKGQKRGGVFFFFLGDL